MWVPKKRNLEVLKGKNMHEHRSDKIYKFKNMLSIKMTTTGD
jgi:hypothetical protein